ncbi:Uncharacterized protein BP5553_03279 [Venustampulla echinocandica]|uniref:MARVEL domain-containing protein n=1 Tax=Venustampulla echinocandica TaxID=2656787 RepID=A0A370TTT0_9HELO|nr:Uncharacterized protein BP5553_03279 [Venustampulla echinocandica]RDL38939.1 Uncharacterized protein BP5553_03279 [Venustampulla echinocandica]
MAIPRLAKRATDLLDGMGNIAIPWTFILLLTISVATLISLLVTIVLYNFTFLSPRFNLILNGGIAFFWALGFSMLSWSISTSNVLGKACTRDVWDGDAAASVCRDYKALWAMTLVGTVSTALALALDFHTWKKSTHRGTYVLPEDDKCAQKLNDLKSVQATNGDYEVPKDQASVTEDTETPTRWHQEADIGYHNRYGAEETHGPLEAEERNRLGHR